MSYDPLTDFLGLLRRTSGGMRATEIPGLDYIVAALARANLFALSVGSTAPTTNQDTTVWLLPASQSWAAEGTVFLWNSAIGAYEPATPALWSALFASAAGGAIQEITAPGPASVQVSAGIVLVNQAISAPITLIMPEAVFKNGPVLISDWKADSGAGNTITVQRSGADVFPGGATSWQIAGNGASLNFRPLPGRGYVF
jgi:hypothetical protein